MKDGKQAGSVAKCFYCQAKSGTKNECKSDDDCKPGFECFDYEDKGMWCTVDDKDECADENSGKGCMETETCSRDSRNGKEDFLQCMKDGKQAGSVAKCFYCQADAAETTTTKKSGTHPSCPTAAEAVSSDCCTCKSDEGGGEPNGDWHNGNCCSDCTAVCAVATTTAPGKITAAPKTTMPPPPPPAIVPAPTAAEVAALKAQLDATVKALADMQAQVDALKASGGDATAVTVAEQALAATKENVDEQTAAYSAASSALNSNNNSNNDITPIVKKKSAAGPVVGVLVALAIVCVAAVLFVRSRDTSTARGGNQFNNPNAAYAAPPNAAYAAPPDNKAVAGHGNSHGFENPAYDSVA